MYQGGGCWISLQANSKEKQELKTVAKSNIVNFCKETFPGNGDEKIQNFLKTVDVQIGFMPILDQQSLRAIEIVV